MFGRTHGYKKTCSEMQTRSDRFALSTNFKRDNESPNGNQWGGCMAEIMDTGNDIKIGRTRKADLVLVLDIHKGQTESLREWCCSLDIGFTRLPLSSFRLFGLWLPDLSQTGDHLVPNALILGWHFAIWRSDMIQTAHTSPHTYVYACVSD